MTLAPAKPKKALTVQDFELAAGVREQGVTPTPLKIAQPARQPGAQAIADAASQAPAPIERRAPQQNSLRIDGFGAEGAMLSPGPVAARRPGTAGVSRSDEVLPVTDDPELAAIAKPSNEEMAEAAIQPKLPNLYSRDGRLIVPAPLKGSHDILVHQNEMADEEGLSRIQDEADLERLRAHHQLVDFPESASLRVNPELPEDRRCARPWSVRFTTDMAHAFYERFHEPVQVNSAVRTVQYQLRLERVNGNAAAVYGEGASPHLTGQAIDIGKRGMSVAQIAWMRAYLMPLIDAGKVDVEEEFQQACFHISVYRSYLGPVKKRRDVAALEMK